VLIFPHSEPGKQLKHANGYEWALWTKLTRLQYQAAETDSSDIFIPLFDPVNLTQQWTTRTCLKEEDNNWSDIRTRGILWVRKLWKVCWLCCIWCWKYWRIKYRSGVIKCVPWRLYSNVGKGIFQWLSDMKRTGSKWNKCYSQNKHQWMG
jgi:hypothetical protein